MTVVRLLGVEEDDETDSKLSLLIELCDDDSDELVAELLLSDDSDVPELLDRWPQ